jgi:hypothetical protein
VQGFDQRLNAHSVRRFEHNDRSARLRYGTDAIPVDNAMAPARYLTQACKLKRAQSRRARMLPEDIVQAVVHRRCLVRLNALTDTNELTSSGGYLCDASAQYASICFSSVRFVSTVCIFIARARWMHAINVLKQKRSRCAADERRMQAFFLFPTTQSAIFKLRFGKNFPVKV